MATIRGGLSRPFWRFADGAFGALGISSAVPPLLLLVGVTLAFPPHRILSHYQVTSKDTNVFTWVVVAWASAGIAGAIGTLFSRRWGFAVLALVHAPALLGGWTRADVALTAWCGSRLLGLGPARAYRRRRRTAEDA